MIFSGKYGINTVSIVSSQKANVLFVSNSMIDRLSAMLSRFVPKGSLSRHLAANAAGSLLLAVSSKLLMLLMSVLLARWMGAEGYGVYATAMALVWLLTVPTGLGLPTLMVRLLSSYRIQKQWRLMRGLLVRGNQAILLASLVMVLIAAGVIWGLRARVGDDEAITFALALVLIPLISLGAMRSASLRGLHHVILGQLPESFIVPVLFLGAVAGWWLINGTPSLLSPETVIVARIAATGVAFLVGSRLLIKRIPSQVWHATPRYDIQAWRHAALPLLFIASVNVVNTQTDLLMLAAMRGSESAGVYQAATRGAELVAFSLVIVNMAIQPSLANLFASKDNIRLQRVATLGARAASFAALPVALVMIFWGSQILSLVFGSEFERGAIALAILSGAQMVNAITGPAAELLKMTGHEWDATKGMIVGVLANVILNALLIPRWDIVGAAIATGTSLILWNLVLVILVWRRLGVNATAAGGGKNRHSE